MTQRGSAPDEPGQTSTHAAQQAAGIGPASAYPHPAAAGTEQSARDIGICLLVAIAEAFLVLVAMNGLIPLPVMLLAHCAIMLGLTLVLDQRERFRLDSRVLAVAVVTTAVSGPLGAACSGLLGVYLRYRKLETELLAKWYERISGHAQADAVVELHERIQAGRTLNPYVDARARFRAILRAGPLDEKQRVLSIITQKYHPDFAALLEMALRNQDPPIRVQAAAVVARLKEQERLKLKSLAAQAAAADEVPGARTADEQVALASRIAATLDSGLLDDQDATTARALAKSAVVEVHFNDPGHVGATLLLARLLIREGDDAAAADQLEPLVAQGVGEAAPLLRATLVRLRRYSRAATVPQGRQAAADGTVVTRFAAPSPPPSEVGDPA